MDVERTMEFILEQQAQAAAIRVEHEAEMARLDAEMKRLDMRLRRAVRLAVQEARAERKRRRELDERFELKMDQLASAHLLAEEAWKRAGDKIDRLSDKIDRILDTGFRGNGHPQ